MSTVTLPMHPIGAPRRPTISADIPGPGRSANPLPAAQRCAFLFGAALLEQKFTPEQAAGYMRRVLETRHA